jgi:hypothetical protein
VADRTPKPPPARDRLTQIVKRDYTIGRNTDDRVFIVPKTGANVALLSGAAKARLAADHLKLLGTTVGRAPLDETWQAVEGMALDVEHTELPLRVAEQKGTVVVDLGDPCGACVVVTADGWKHTDRSPVTFRRSKAQRALPAPAPGTATWADLYALVNIDTAQRDVYRGWLATSMIRSLPHPILDLKGPQGSAKTTAARITSSLIDPCPVETLSPPRDAEGWATTVSARWVPSIDNVSKIDPWWADELCRTATGAGTLRRQLYSDDDVVARVLRGAVILNGVTMSGATRPDLAERMLPLELTRPDAYRSETDIMAAVDRIAAGVLALILDDVVAILAAAGTADVGDLRMTDFARALDHLDAAADTKALDGYRELHEQHSRDTLNADPVALTVQTFMANRTTWEGTGSELLSALNPIRDALVSTGDIAFESYWPSDATRVSSALTRSSALLHRIGIRIERRKSTAGARSLMLTRTPASDDTGGASGASGAEHPLSPLALLKEGREGPSDGSNNTGGNSATSADSASTRGRRRIRARALRACANPSCRALLMAEIEYDGGLCARCARLARRKKKGTAYGM